MAEEILGQAPEDIDALEIRALVAVERGDDQAAEEALRSAIATAPERRWPYADLARLLLKQERKAEAEAVAQDALAADPNNADAHAVLGTLFAAREQWFEAGRHFQKAIELVGDHPVLLAGFGKALLRQGRLNHARRTLEKSVAADGQALEPLVHLAEVEERDGRFDRAAELLGRAEPIARRQGTDVDLQRSVLLARTGDTPAALALLETCEELSGAALLQRGRLREHVGRYAEAWDDWVAGKAALGKRRPPYQAADVRREAEWMAQLAERASPAATLSDDPQPIFVIGFPRSGTTLVEQILASHAAIRAGGELPFGAELREYAGGPRTLRSPDELRDFYVERARSYGLLDTDARFFTDKMPDNAFWLPLLRLAFPQSPVVLLRRHPLDVLTSVMAHDMTHGFSCGYRLEDAATHLALVDELLQKYRGTIHELGYEKLVADQQGETARLMAAIGLDVEPAQLSFHQRAEVSPTPSYAKVREPLNDRSIGRGRHFAGELEPIRPIIAKVMARGCYAG